MDIIKRGKRTIRVLEAIEVFSTPPTPKTNEPKEPKAQAQVKEESGFNKNLFGKKATVATVEVVEVSNNDNSTAGDNSSTDDSGEEDEETEPSSEVGGFSRDLFSSPAVSKPQSSIQEPSESGFSADLFGNHDNKSKSTKTSVVNTTTSLEVEGVEESSDPFARKGSSLAIEIVEESDEEFIVPDSFNTDFQPGNITGQHCTGGVTIVVPQGRSRRSSTSKPKKNWFGTVMSIGASLSVIAIAALNTVNGGTGMREVSGVVSKGIGNSCTILTEVHTSDNTGNPVKFIKPETFYPSQGVPCPVNEFVSASVYKEQLIHLRIVDSSIVD